MISIAPTAINVDVKLIPSGLPRRWFQWICPPYRLPPELINVDGGMTPCPPAGEAPFRWWPIVGLLQVPVAMMGHDPGDDGLHAPNESYSLDMFSHGIETAIVYMDELTQLG